MDELADEIEALMSIGEQSCRVDQGPPVRVTCALEPRDAEQQQFVAASLALELPSCYPAQPAALSLADCRGQVGAALVLQVLLSAARPG